MTATKQKQEESVGVIHVYSYKLLNDHIKFLYPKLRTMEKSIKQAMMPIPFEVYVSSMVFFSLIAGICGVIIGLIATQFINIQPAIVGYLLPSVTGMALMAMTFVILQTIPPVRGGLERDTRRSLAPCGSRSRSTRWRVWGVPPSPTWSCHG